MYHSNQPTGGGEEREGLRGGGNRSLMDQCHVYQFMNETKMSTWLPHRFKVSVATHTPGAAVADVRVGLA